MMYHWIVSMSYTTGAISGVGTAYYSRTHKVPVLQDSCYKEYMGYKEMSDDVHER